MKKLIFVALVAFSVDTFAQGVEKNGTIYKKHPYITVVNQISDLFVKGDTVALAKFYADTAKFADSPDPKTYNLKMARSNWKWIVDNWDITIKPRGYPDALQYDIDPFTVQSWWTITVVNKKTQKKAVVEEVVFDTFNKDGKITFEGSYYDASAFKDAMK